MGYNSYSKGETKNEKEQTRTQDDTRTITRLVTYEKTSLCPKEW